MVLWTRLAAVMMAVMMAVGACAADRAEQRPVSSSTMAKTTSTTAAAALTDDERAHLWRVFGDARVDERFSLDHTADGERVAAILRRLAAVSLDATAAVRLKAWHDAQKQVLAELVSMDVSAAARYLKGMSELLVDEPGAGPLSHDEVEALIRGGNDVFDQANNTTDDLAALRAGALAERAVAEQRQRVGSTAMHPPTRREIAAATLLSSARPADADDDPQWLRALAEVSPCHARSAEARAYLKAVWVIEEAHRAENDQYTDDVDALGLERPPVGFQRRIRLVDGGFVATLTGETKSLVAGEEWVIDHTGTLKNRKRGCPAAVVDDAVFGPLLTATEERVLADLLATHAVVDAGMEPAVAALNKILEAYRSERFGVSALPAAVALARVLSSHRPSLSSAEVHRRVRGFIPKLDRRQGSVPLLDTEERDLVAAFVDEPSVAVRERTDAILGLVDPRHEGGFSEPTVRSLVALVRKHRPGAVERVLQRWLPEACWQIESGVMRLLPAGPFEADTDDLRIYGDATVAGLRALGFEATLEEWRTPQTFAIDASMPAVSILRGHHLRIEAGKLRVVHDACAASGSKRTDEKYRAEALAAPSLTEQGRRRRLIAVANPAPAAMTVPPQTALTLTASTAALTADERRDVLRVFGEASTERGLSDREAMRIAAILFRLGEQPLDASAAARLQAWRGAHQQLVLFLVSADQQAAARYVDVMARLIPERPGAGPLSDTEVVDLLDRRGAAHAPPGLEVDEGELDSWAGKALAERAVTEQRQRVGSTATHPPTWPEIAAALVVRIGQLPPTPERERLDDEVAEVIAEVGSPCHRASWEGRAFLKGVAFAEEARRAELGRYSARARDLSLQAPPAGFRLDIRLVDDGYVATLAGEPQSLVALEAWVVRSGTYGLVVHTQQGCPAQVVDDAVFDPLLNTAEERALADLVATRAVVDTADGAAVLDKLIEAYRVDRTTVDEQSLAAVLARVAALHHPSLSRVERERRVRGFVPFLTAYRHHNRTTRKHPVEVLFDSEERDLVAHLLDEPPGVSEFRAAALLAVLHPMSDVHWEPVATRALALVRKHRPDAAARVQTAWREPVCVRLNDAVASLLPLVLPDDAPPREPSPEIVEDLQAIGFDVKVEPKTLAIDAQMPATSILAGHHVRIEPGTLRVVSNACPAAPDSRDR